MHKLLEHGDHFKKGDEYYMQGKWNPVPDAWIVVDYEHSSTFERNQIPVRRKISEELGDSKNSAEKSAALRGNQQTKDIICPVCNGRKTIKAPGNSKYHICPECNGTDKQ